MAAGAAVQRGLGVASGVLACFFLTCFALGAGVNAAELSTPAPRKISSSQDEGLGNGEAFSNASLDAGGALISQVGRFVPEGDGALLLAEPKNWGDRGRALRLPGGEAMPTVLEVAPSLGSSGTLEFVARKDGRRKPFGFFVTTASGDGAELRHDLTSQVNGSEVNRVVVPLPSGVVSVRFEVTAPRARGVWIDDLVFQLPTPMEVTRVSYVPVRRPLVAGESVDVGVLEVETAGSLAPLALESVRLIEPAAAAEDRVLGEAVVDGLNVDGERPLSPGLNRMRLSVQVRDLDEVKLGAEWDRSWSFSVVASLGGVEVEADQLEASPADRVPRSGAAQLEGGESSTADESGALAFRLARRITPADRTCGSVSLAAAPALSTEDGETLLCAVSPESGSEEHTQVFRSQTAGASWEELKLAPALGSVVGASLTYDFLQKRFHLVGSAEDGGLLYATCDRAGESWSAPRVLEEIEWPRGVRVAGSSGIMMSDGTLVVPVVVTGGFRIEDEDCAGILVIIDGGKSWRLPPAAYPNTTTAAVVEVGDGALMLNMTDGRGGARSDRLTRSLGDTWNRRTAVRPDQLHLSAGGDGALLHVGRARRGVMDARFAFAN
ncbi:MAG: sialidase family protein, partial [Planctomycetota bacterium]